MKRNRLIILIILLLPITVKALEIDGEIETNFIKTNYYTINDIEIRKEPNNLSEVIGTISKDINIDISEDDILNEEIIDNWIHVSDGKINGYINYDINNINIGQKIDKYYYYVSFNNDYNIKYGDRIKVLYTTNYNDIINYYIEINDERIKLNKEDIGLKSNNKLIILDFKNIDILDINLNKIKDNNIFRRNKEYKISYYTNMDTSIIYYLELNNNTYKIILNDKEYYKYDSNYVYSAIEVNEENIYTFKEDMYYSFSNNETYKLIKKGSKVSAYILYNVNDKVYYSNKLGFIYSISSNLNINIEDLIIEKLPEINEIEYVEDNYKDNTRDFIGILGITILSVLIFLVGYYKYKEFTLTKM